MSENEPPAARSALGVHLARLAHLTHLARRFAGSLSRRPPTALDDQWALAMLRSATRLDTPAQVTALVASGEELGELWMRLSNVDRRHALLVTRRFIVERPDATTAEIAGALMHDVGKIDSGLGTFERVAATIIGPRTKRWRRYHDHEAIGAELLTAHGGSPATVELVLRRGPAAKALERADNI